MNDSYKYALALPPRHVPWGVRVRLLFGGGISQFGWIWLGFCSIFVWVFGAQTDFSSIVFALDTVETARGVVTSVEPTSASVNDTPVYANHYTYRIERLESEHEGVSYTTGYQFQAGQDVMVEYLKRYPTMSRIEDTRRGQFDLWIVPFLSIFLLIGLGMVGFGVKNGIKANRLLTNGKVGMGELVSRERTNTKVNGRQVYKFTFEFTADDGQIYQVVNKTTDTQALQDDPQERLLYDPYNPRYAVMFDNLPGSPDIDELGHIQAQSPIPSFITLFLPALVIAVNGVVFMFVVWWQIV
jgi:hypothetical protein